MMNGQHLVDFWHEELSKADIEPPKRGYPTQSTEYADRENHKYPLDTEAHVRAAISYFSMPKNSGKYEVSQQKLIWSRIKKQAKKFGIEVNHK